MYDVQFASELLYMAVEGGSMNRRDELDNFHQNYQQPSSNEERKIEDAIRNIKKIMDIVKKITHDLTNYHFHSKENDLYSLFRAFLLEESVPHKFEMNN